MLSHINHPPPPPPPPAPPHGNPSALIIFDPKLRRLDKDWVIMRQQIQSQGALRAVSQMEREGVVGGNGATVTASHPAPVEHAQSMQLSHSRFLAPSECPEPVLGPIFLVLIGVLLTSAQLVLYQHRLPPASSALKMMARLRNPQYSSLLRRAGELRQSGALCDAVVMVGDQAFRAHSLVLACISRELERQLTLDEDSHHRSCHCIVDALPPRTFQQVLDYAYADSLEVPADDLRGLLKAAQFLEMEELREQCLEQLRALDHGKGVADALRREVAEEKSAEESPAEHSDIEVADLPPRSSSRSKETEHKDNDPHPAPPRVSVIASATSSPPTPASSPTRPSKHSWGALASRAMPPPTTDFALRSLQSSQPLLAYSIPYTTPIYPLYTPPAFPQVHESLMNYARLLHPFHQSLLQAPQKLAVSVKHSTLGKKVSSADEALIGNVSEGGERKLQGCMDRVLHCLHCRKDFLDSRSIPMHAVTSSVPLEPLFCPFCGKSQTSRSGHLSPHARRWSHLCQDCGRSFTSNTALRRHQRLHTGEKPFECRLCSQRSRDYSAMIKHLRTHGGASPYQCTICLEYCNSLAAMQKHLKTHPVQDFPPDWSISNTYLYTSHN
ncbi:hypothetical protein JZ751_018500 [Albula glossodonta]|uniref:Uncharacterized protein n=1 Tax=Albula glossodonta TaxID=121402 RepID=A0A8T2NWC4_9TELE|nr:hypothetical protein JZ751_018500 [Albula glossodonta]